MLARMGAPSSCPRPHDMLAITGTPLEIQRSTCPSEEKRLTEALRPKAEAYAVLNGQLPLPR